ncbi:MAG: hypothetical protein ABW220_06460 [Burkholderiaceae bacterium]
MNIVPQPPVTPCPDWMRQFAEETLRRRPGLTPASAEHSALLAHSSTWLMDGAEAAELWMLAVDAALAERSRLPRDLPG